MGFSELLQDKIERRRVHGSTVRDTAEKLRQQALARVADVQEAVTNMASRLVKEPVFAAGFGAAPRLRFKWAADNPNISSFIVEGPVGSFTVLVQFEAALFDRPTRTRLSLQIAPEWSLREELGCGWIYGEATPVEGDIADIGGFVAAAEDMLAEFLADVVVCPHASRYLPGAV